jgi:hypothetical protein
VPCEQSTACRDTFSRKSFKDTSSCRPSPPHFNRMSSREIRFPVITTCNDSPGRANG